MKKHTWIGIAVLLILSFIGMMNCNDAYAQSSKKKMSKPSSGINYNRGCYNIIKMDGINELIEQKYDVNCKLPANKDKNDLFPPLKSLLNEDEALDGFWIKNTRNIVTPIFYAYDPEEFEMLLKAGANVNAKDSSGQTILYDMALFSEEGSEEILDILIKAHIDVNAKDKAGLTALENAIPVLLTNAFGWVEDGKLSGDDFNDDEGSQYRKNFEQIHIYMSKLIEAGAKLKNKKYSAKSLQEMEPEQFVQALLASVNLNAKDVSGRTILHKVMMKMIQDMPHGSKFVNECKEQNLIPRDIQSGQLYDPVKALIDAGADVNIKDSQGRTAIFYVRNPHVAEALIDAHANINIRDNEGNTPLLWLVKEDAESADFPAHTLELVKQFVAAGADVNIKDNAGKTALDYAQDDAIKELLSISAKGADHAKHKT